MKKSMILFIIAVVLIGYYGSAMADVYRGSDADGLANATSSAKGPNASDSSRGGESTASPRGVYRAVGGGSGKDAKEGRVPSVQAADPIPQYYDIHASIRVEGLGILPPPRTFRRLKVINLTRGGSYERAVSDFTFSVPSGCDYLVEATVQFYWISGGIETKSAIITGLNRDTDVLFTFRP